MNRLLLTFFAFMLLAGTAGASEDRFPQAVGSYSCSGRCGENSLSASSASAAQYSYGAKSWGTGVNSIALGPPSAFGVGLTVAAPGAASKTFSIHGRVMNVRHERLWSVLLYASSNCLDTLTESVVQPDGSYRFADLPAMQGNQACAYGITAIHIDDDEWPDAGTYQRVKAKPGADITLNLVLAGDGVPTDPTP